MSKITKKETRLLEDLAEAEDDFLHPEKYLGTDSITYLKKIKTDINQFVLPIATFVDNVAIGTGATKVVGGGLGIIGGGLAAGGIIAAPFTLGVSLILTFTGLGITLGGTGATFVASVTKLALDKKKKKQSEKALKEINQQLGKFVKIVSDYDQAVQATRGYFSTERGRERLKNIINFIKIAGAPASAGLTIGKIVLVAQTVIRLWEAFEESAQISIQAIWSEVAIGGKVFIAAGSKAAVVLASAGAVLSVGFGIWDCVSGAKDINMGLKSKKSAENNVDGGNGGKQENETPGEKSAESINMDNNGGQHEDETSEDVKLINDEKELRDEKQKHLKKEATHLAEYIRKQAKEMENHIDTMLKAYLDMRSEIEEQKKACPTNQEGLKEFIQKAESNIEALM